MTTPINATETQWNSASPRRTGMSRGTIWTGRVLSGLSALFLMVDGAMKLFKPAVVVQGTVQLGFPESSIIPIGIVLLISTILYAVPRTAVPGAILLTGYLGGAVSTHVRVSGSWFNTLFPVFFGALLWGGLWFRNSRVRNLLPIIGA